jgi:hypothetical protein
MQHWGLLAGRIGRLPRRPEQPFQFSPFISRIKGYFLTSVNATILENGYGIKTFSGILNVTRQSDLTFCRKETIYDAMD